MIVPELQFESPHAPLGSRMPTVYYIGAVAALGGLLFGYDTAIVNGALMFLKRDFGLNDTGASNAASSLIFGCVVGAGSAGWLADRFGRKRVLFISAFLFLVSAIGAALPTTLGQFIGARVLGGVGIGIASLVSPLYIAELSPARQRGRLVSLNQFAIVSGILAAYLASYLLSGFGAGSWRWMFASAAFPAVLFLSALLFVPESPRWLLQKGLPGEAHATLVRVFGASDASEHFQQMNTISGARGSITKLLRKPLRRPVFLGITLAILQQLTGINTILYYGSLILTEHVPHGTDKSALIGNVSIGITNLVFTVLAMAYIDRLGRKPLLLSATGGMITSLAVLAAVATFRPQASRVLIAFILVYVACFAFGLGPGVWVLLSEIFPQEVRGRAMSVSTVALWIACLLITWSFLRIVDAISMGGAFLLYAFASGFTFVFIWRMLPETRGRTLEEIERWWK